jgi:hypothetical protein
MKVPWDRIAQFHGRGSAIPPLIEKLAGPGSARAAKRLADLLEHQDGVIQATPFGVRAILEALRAGRVRNRAAALAALRRINAAAAFQLSASPQQQCSETLRGLIRVDRLLPTFVSNDDDEALLEEWAPSESEHHGWCALTHAMIERSGILKHG